MGPPVTTPEDLGLLAAGLPRPLSGAFSTRRGGVSAGRWEALNLALHVSDDQRRVQANRGLLARAVGLEADRLVFAQQVHGSGVAVVDRSHGCDPDGAVHAVDALVTTTPRLGLVVLAADCLPVLLADPVAGVVAAAHAGRQGLVAGVLQQTVAAMVGVGADPGRIHATLGPAICGRCYQLPASTVAEVEAVVPGAAATTRAGQPAADLPRGAERLLRGAGIRQIRRVGGCTYEQPQRWFSYRRDGVTGRHAGLVWLQP